MCIYIYYVYVYVYVCIYIYIYIYIFPRFLRAPGAGLPGQVRAAQAPWLLFACSYTGVYYICNCSSSNYL